MTRFSFRTLCCPDPPALSLLILLTHSLLCTLLAMARALSSMLTFDLLPLFLEPHNWWPVSDALTSMVGIDLQTAPFECHALQPLIRASSTTLSTRANSKTANQGLTQSWSKGYSPKVCTLLSTGSTLVSTTVDRELLLCNAKQQRALVSLPNQQLSILYELVLWHFQVVRSRSPSDPTTSIIVRAVTWAEPAMEVAGISNRHAAEMCAHTQAHNPLHKKENMI
jgi:hypothetical protein